MGYPLFHIINMLLFLDVSATDSSTKCPSISPSAPPPAYSEIDTSSWRPTGDQEQLTVKTEPLDEPGPPGYESVMKQQQQSTSQQQTTSEHQQSTATQPQPVRKKSLTNHNV